MGWYVNYSIEIKLNKSKNLFDSEKIVNEILENKRPLCGMSFLDDKTCVFYAEIKRGSPLFLRKMVDFIALKFKSHFDVINGEMTGIEECYDEDIECEIHLKVDE